MDPTRRLEEQRAETLRRLADLSADYAGVVVASKDTNADDEHDPEGATIAFERAQLGSLVRQLEVELEEVDSALARVASGAYGVCERCGGAIGEGRLEARPTARRCIGCAGSG